MSAYARDKQRGFILGGVLLVLALLSFIMLRAFELSLMQKQLLQLFQHKTNLINKAEDHLNQLSLELEKTDLNSGSNYTIQFDRQDACLNRYYQLESWDQDALIEAHIKAMFIKVPGHGLAGCDYKLGSRLVVEEIK